jgi:uncharacterized protein YkwD
MTGDRARAKPLRTIALAVAGLSCLAGAAHAFDLNSFRRAHRLPPLSYSAAYAAAAQAHADDMARREHMDHAGWQARLGALSARAAENVAYIQCPRHRVETVAFGGASGCASADRAYRMWARSPGHRRNMLMKGISHYGLGDAVSAGGRHYWVLDMGN